MKINMVRFKLLIFVCTLIFFISGCSSDDGEKKEYSTVSNMIADRNKARFKADAAKKGHSSSSNQDSTSEEISTKQSEEEKFTGMTFEENVIIVSESTGRTISKGTAYLDKTGKIINIRISNK